MAAGAAWAPAWAPAWATAWASASTAVCTVSRMHRSAMNLKRQQPKVYYQWYSQKQASQPSHTLQQAHTHSNKSHLWTKKTTHTSAMPQGLKYSLMKPRWLSLRPGSPPADRPRGGSRSGSTFLTCTTEKRTGASACAETPGLA